ncbi:MAG: hypothetical protein Fur0010_03290 [Bdellovibrio sp.]
MKWLISLILIVSFNAHAAKEAIVKAKKAIVYADIKLTSPIGYLRQGKKIAVGEVKRNRGEVVPIVVNQRIAYLRVQDLSIEGDDLQEYQGARVSEDFYDEKEEQRRFDPLNENNYVHFHYGAVTPKESSLSVMEAVNETPTASSQIGLFIEHRHPLKNNAWGVGAKMFSTASESIKYRTIAIEARYQWIMFRLATLAIGPYIGIMGTGDYRIDVNDVGSYRGAMYGGAAGAEARLFSDKKISFSLGMQMMTQKLTGFERIENAVNDEIVSATSVQAFEAFGALVWKF